MNETTLNLLNNGSMPSITFIVGAVIITILLTVILVQSRRIQFLTKPRFGFLGKPLALVLVFSILVGSVGFAFYNNQTPEDVAVSGEDVNLNPQIITTQLSRDTYSFKLIPFLNDVAWGDNDTFKFDIFWSIINGSSVVKTESGISKNNPGGITEKFEKGTFIVKASVFFVDKSYSVETTIVIE